MPVLIKIEIESPTLSRTENGLDQELAEWKESNRDCKIIDVTSRIGRVYYYTKRTRKVLKYTGVLTIYYEELHGAKGKSKSIP